MESEIINNKLEKIFKRWVLASGIDLDAKIKHCHTVTKCNLCLRVLSLIKAAPEDFKDPLAFYNFVVDIADLVADDFYHLWLSGYKEDATWLDYEAWIPTYTAKVIQKMIPELIPQKFAISIFFNFDSNAIINKVIKQYEITKNPHQGYNENNLDEIH